MYPRAAHPGNSLRHSSVSFGFCHTVPVTIDIPPSASRRSRVASLMHCVAYSIYAGYAWAMRMYVGPKYVSMYIIAQPTRRSRRSLCVDCGACPGSRWCAALRALKGVRYATAAHNIHVREFRYSCDRYCIQKIVDFGNNNIPSKCFHLEFPLFRLGVVNPG
jgi:hypothetical protein